MCVFVPLNRAVSCVLDVSECKIFFGPRYARRGATRRGTRAISSPLAKSSRLGGEIPCCQTTSYDARNPIWSCLGGTTRGGGRCCYCLAPLHNTPSKGTVAATGSSVASCSSRMAYAYLAKLLKISQGAGGEASDLERLEHARVPEAKVGGRAGAAASCSCDPVRRGATTGRRQLRC